MIKILGKIILKLWGWKTIDTTPKGVLNYPKAVMIAAPHTSNWDYPFTMALLYASGIPLKYLAKASLFKFPLGFIIKGLGGVPVERSKKNNLVNDMADMIKNSTQPINLVIPVEGTRGFTEVWKSGFYHIALAANVPIILGFLDFAKKEGGYINVFYPTGNYEMDLKAIQKQYLGITPKHPEFNSLKNFKG
jgi:1-acyl-sn-glycerol-3-phosphate acyltransferase